MLLHGYPVCSPLDFANLKPSEIIAKNNLNVMKSMEGDWSAKLGDFGIISLAEQKADQLMAQTLIGTLTFMSPERLTGKAYSFAADIWGLGLSLINAACGAFPISTEKGQWGLIHSIQTETIGLPKVGNFSDQFRDFITHCMCRDPNDRWSASLLLV